LIGWLQGQLLHRGSDGEVLLNVGGVGYRVTVPASVLASLGDVGATVSLFVHTHVREDAIVLYGFPTAAERGCFEALLAAHGVGPSLALGVLCTLRPESLVRAVADDDVDLLCSIPGIGRKTAARLVLDLKAKLDLPEDPVSVVRGATATSGRSEVRAALVELGYGPDEVRRAVGGLPDEGSVEDLLRSALRELAAAGSRR